MGRTNIATRARVRASSMGGGLDAGSKNKITPVDFLWVCDFPARFTSKNPRKLIGNVCRYMRE